MEGVLWTHGSHGQSSGFHRQTNSQIEQAIQDLERLLCCIVSQNPSSWSQQMIWIEYAHNSLPVLSIGMSVFSGLSQRTTSVSLTGEGGQCHFCGGIHPMLSSYLEVCAQGLIRSGERLFMFF